MKCKEVHFQIALTSTTNHTWKLQFPLLTQSLWSNKPDSSLKAILWVNKSVRWADATPQLIAQWGSDVVTCPEVCDILFCFRLQKFREEDSNLYFSAKSPWRWREFSCHPRVMVYAERTGAELTDMRVKRRILLLDKTSLWIYYIELSPPLTSSTLSECTVSILFTSIAKPATPISVETASCKGFCPL